MALIDFFNLTHADLGGGRVVTKPFVVGKLTPEGMDYFENKQNSECRYFQLVHETFYYERKWFGEFKENIYDATSDFREINADARTPFWHQDGMTSRFHMYLVGSADERMNTEYAAATLRLRDSTMNNLERSRNTYSHCRLQRAITNRLQRRGEINRVGAGEVLLMPQRTWHRSSPHHAERTKPWPFLRVSIYRPD